ncbi:MAG: hypothetical protein MUC87_09065 [Bacteroidia bacterium]|jgi:hypothetical protein|nr:hypothetical protein [Bacteroidia bacterium]
MEPLQLHQVFSANPQLLNFVYREPQVIAYNRLESRARTEDFTRSLRAEVRDAMWMLTRQWQMGEFEAEDAGSAIDARLLTHENAADRFRIKGGDGQLYTSELPLETIAEREKIKFSLALQVQVAQYFLKLHSSALRSKYEPAYRKAFGLPLANEEAYLGQTDGANLYQALKRRGIDGEKLLKAIADGTLLAKAEIETDDTALITQYCQQLEQWFARQYSQPVTGTDNAWNTQKLSYELDIAAPRQGKEQYVLEARNYSEGQLDWYSFDLAPRTESIALKPEPAHQFKDQTISFLPTAAAFKGMPNPRFWEFEDRQVNFGNLNATTTDQLMLVFAELGLIYGNDWCVIPYPMQVNSLCEIRALVVTDVFGDRTMITASGAGADKDWERWCMFGLSNSGNMGNYNRLFFLPAALSQTLESEPVEKLNFMRDEMTNMIWAIEKTIPDATGKGINGDEAADKTGILPEVIPGSTAPTRYILGTSVPENWIPFLPVHKPGSDQEIYLQRAAMPKLGSPPKEVVKAKGVLLNEVPSPYFINEEEIPYSGTIVTRTWQRTRWYNGETLIWMGRKRTTGRGEGSSNLRFDQIDEK